jgi:hypothetical protein
VRARRSARFSCNNRPVPAIWTARVGGQVAWLDSLEAAARAIVVLAQADIFEFAAHQSKIEQLFPWMPGAEPLHTVRDDLTVAPVKARCAEAMS